MLQKIQVYEALVNRVPEIREKYHTVRDAQTHAWQRPVAWLYLAQLNVRYRCGGLRGKRRNGLSEKESGTARRLAELGSESALSLRESPEALAQRLAAYDVISFDVFDTLLLRPFEKPEDLFYVLGQRLEYLDFKRLRMNAEAEARRDCMAARGHREAALPDIWRSMERETGIPAGEGMRAEIETEEQFCAPNPYMLELARLLHRQGKRIILVSDMYLPAQEIERLVRGCGYPEPEACFVSCECGCSKGDGGLYRTVEKYLGKLRYVHIGDNPQSDGEQARKAGWESVLCPNVNRTGEAFRATAMSAVMGSLYRGIVNAQLHNGLRAWDADYEYGFVYGGILAVGYCQFIHRCAAEREIERILFLSRDGDILSQVYRLLYPQDDIRYALWSRLAAVKMTARFYKYDYFRRFLFHKVNQGFSLQSILETMELADLLETMTEKTGLRAQETLTDKNAGTVRDFLEERWETVLAHYERQIEEGGRYYACLLEGCRRAAAVDIGWAGSGAMALRLLVRRLWKPDCEIIGLVAGTNTPHNAEPDMSEAQLASGELVSYLFSQAHNRDLWERHNPSLGDNVALEWLLASPFPGFRGFVGQDWEQETLRPEKTERARRAARIQQGILDFCRKYQESGAQTCIREISGRDAAAPVYLWIAAHRKEIAQMDIQAVLA